MNMQLLSIETVSLLVVAVLFLMRTRPPLHMFQGCHPSYAVLYDGACERREFVSPRGARLKEYGCT